MSNRQHHSRKLSVTYGCWARATVSKYKNVLEPMTGSVKLRDPKKKSFIVEMDLRGFIPMVYNPPIEHSNSRNYVITGYLPGGYLRVPQGYFVYPIKSLKGAAVSEDQETGVRAGAEPFTT